MAECDKRVLIATLGLSPGAVTTSFDLLTRHLRDTTGKGAIHKLVCLALPSRDGSGKIPNAVRELHDPSRIMTGFDRFVRDEVSCEEVEVCPLNIPHRDLQKDQEAGEFLRLCLREMFAHPNPIVKQSAPADLTCDQTWDVWVSLSGGRKVMSSLASVAAMMTGLGDKCYQAMLEPPDTDMRFEQLMTETDEKVIKQALHPNGAVFLKVPSLTPPTWHRTLIERAWSICGATTAVCASAVSDVVTKVIAGE